jgi:hypothetical protein
MNDVRRSVQEFGDALATDFVLGLERLAILG